MKNTLLISNKYKVLGWIIFLLSGVLGALCFFAEFKIPGFQIYYAIKQNQDSLGAILSFEDYNLTNELAILGITIGLLMIVFAKEKIEDEYISMLRLKSLQWAVLLSYIILIIINFSFYGYDFLIFLQCNIWTTLIVFIAKFYWSLHQFRKEGVTDEK